MMIHARPSEESLNPYEPPSADLHEPTDMIDSEMESMRRAHLAEESYVSFLVVLNGFYAVLFCGFCIYWVHFTVRHLTGRISAPWTVRPDWIVLQLDQLGIVVFAIVAAYGLMNHTRWACRAEALVGFWLSIFLSIAGFITPLMKNNFTVPNFIAGSLGIVPNLRPAT